MSTLAEWERRRFTADEVLRMGEAGILRDDERLELLEGDLVVVDPQGPMHRALSIMMRQLLGRAYGAGVHLQGHATIHAGPRSLPEPDVAVVRGDARDYFEKLPGPGDAVMVVEVAVTSLRADLAKRAVYAQAGIPAFWLLDVSARQLLVHSDPDAAARRYRSAVALGEGDQATPPETEARLRVAELLP